ncbi:MAG: glycerophosphodiester phosphodiesterase [Ruminococcus sp.]|jgi:glycerophosphoryl diester phosphodiesterase
MEKRTVITAHSGADGTPDNSMEFVRYALMHHADVLEVDVRMAKGRLIVSHNETGDDAVALKDIFDTLTAFADTRINCDLKEYDLEEEVLNLARVCGLSPGRLLYSGSVKPAEQSVFCSWREVEVFWNVEECIPDVYKTDEAGQGNPLTDEETEKLIRECRKYGIHVININEKYVTPEFLSAMKESGVRISVWTVNDPKRIREFLDYGIFNITTRHFAEAMALREAVGERSNGK